MKEVDIQFPSEEEYDRLRTIRDKHGVTWRGMLIQGAKQLVGADLRRALTLATSDVESEAFEAAFWMPNGECYADPSPAESQQSRAAPSETDVTQGRTQGDQQDADDVETSNMDEEIGQDATADDEHLETTHTVGNDSLTTSAQEFPSTEDRPLYPSVDRSSRAESEPTGPGHSHDP